MNKRTARVQQYGSNSLYVALPKDWTRGMNIEKGDEVEIVYDGEVRVRARTREARPHDRPEAEDP